jgi:Ca-activated chloride channel family protein
MRGRIVIIVMALAAVAIAFAASGDGGDGDGDDGARPDAAERSAKPAADTVRLAFAYSPEKEGLLAPLVERFNAQRPSSGGGTVVVDASVVPSGEAETRIARGTLRPAVWSPASSFWGRLLNHEADRRLVPDDNPSIVRTPLVSRCGSSSRRPTATRSAASATRS